MEPCAKGKCIDGINKYTCVCDVGYTGHDCDIEINECDSKPCDNGGECTDVEEGFSCSCAAGFYGKTCNKSELSRIFVIFSHATLKQLNKIIIVIIVEPIRQKVLEFNGGSETLYM